MKRLLPFVPLLLLAAVLLSPAAALSGAKQGLGIWWDRVLPALLPSCIAIKLAQDLGLLGMTQGHPRVRMAAIIGFSLLSGAPNGARLLQAAKEEGSLTARQSERLLPLVNCVSPTFLVSIIASELLKNKALFQPMGAAFYGCILSALLLQGLPSGRTLPPVPPAEASRRSFFQALISAMENGMLDMLRIGGCIVLVCTLLALMRPILPNEYAYAILSGWAEVSIGASAIASVSLPLRLKASLLIGFSAFGGLSLALQTECFSPGLKLAPYLLQKAALGVLVGFVCYVLFPLFPSVSTVFASRQLILSRGLSLSALFLSSALSIAFIGVLSLMSGLGKKGPVSK